ncbi:hypothetical protein D3C85_1462580 [compost metagenome]
MTIKAAAFGTGHQQGLYAFIQRAAQPTRRQHSRLCLNYLYRAVLLPRYRCQALTGNALAQLRLQLA